MSRAKDWRILAEATLPVQPIGTTTASRAAPRVVPHLSVAERAARGKAARAETPCSAHGDWQRVAAGIDGQARDFYLRQLWDAKGSAVVEAMSPESLGIYGRVCGWTLARAHARSGDRVAIASYLGRSDSFERAIQAFAEAYADRTERDYAALADAVRSGRLVAQTGL